MIFEKYPYLEDENIILKKIELKDLDRLEKMLQEKEVYQHEPTFLPELLSKSCREFIEIDCERLFQEKSCIILGIYSKDHPDIFRGIAELYGYVPERCKVSIGYRLLTDSWHQHLGTYTVTLLKDYILNDLKLVKITAHVMIDNPGSIKCLQNNGFTQRRAPHEEDWGRENKVIANKYVIYPIEK